VGSRKASADLHDLHPEAVKQPVKPVHEILEQELLEGLNALHRPFTGLLISTFSAGLDIGFSLFLMAAILTRIDGQLPPVVTEMLVANMYGLSFVFVVRGRSELFTEYMTLAVLPIR
jgi:formate/nitrite transporter FocA (FNT family)